MKRLSLKSLITLLRICVIAFMLAITCLFLFSFTIKTMLPADIWQQFGLSKAEGDKHISNSFINGYLYYYGAKNFKNIAAGNRSAIAKDLLEYTKQYAGGATFAKEYAQIRNQAKPLQPELKPVRTIQEIQKDQIAQTEKSIKETEANMKQFTPEVRKGIEPMLEMLRKNLKEFQNPDHKLFSSIALGEKYEREGLMENYKRDMEKWEADYPASVNLFIKYRLQQMLDKTAGIDYSAELVEKYGKMRFVNAAYEAKNTEWKQGYRAGKEVTESARAFVKAWLEELK